MPRLWFGEGRTHVHPAERRHAGRRLRSNLRMRTGGRSRLL